MIIHGTRIRRRSRGLIAEFCPICREIRLFRVTDLSRYRHVYWIPVTPGTPVSRELQCEGCGTALMERIDDQTSPIPRTSANVIHVLAQTRPHRIESVRERLALEQRLVEGSATPAERIHLLIEPLILLSPVTDIRGRQSASESLTSIVILIWIVSIFGIAITWSGGQGPASMTSHSGSQVFWIRVASMASCVVFGLWSIERVLRHKRRFSMRFAIEPVVTAYAAILPTREEIDCALQAARGSVHNVVAKGLTTDEIVNRLGDRMRVQTRPVHGTD